MNDSTLSDDDLAKLLAELQKGRKRDADYLTGAKKRARLQEKHVARDINGALVFFDPNLFNDEEVIQVCANRNCTKAQCQDSTSVRVGGLTSYRTFFPKT